MKTGIWALDASSCMPVVATMLLQSFRGCDEPTMRCADLDWSELGDDGKMRNSGVAIGRKVLETKLKLERQWHKRYKGLKKAELLEEVLQIVR